MPVIDWTKLKSMWKGFRESLPIELIVVQIRDHKFILLIWLVLLGILSGMVAGELGGAYLLLEPEYLGKENFWSAFLIGSALGGFLFAYMITIYISESFRYHFIILTDSPFLVFSFNNLLIPIFFFFLYFYRFIEFHVITHGSFTWVLWEKLMGLGTGIGIVFLLSASFFFARRSITSFLEKPLQKGLEKGRGKSNRRVIIGKAKESFNARSRPQASSYLRFPFTIKKVNPLDGMEFRKIVKILSQHHERILLIQIITLILIAVLGLLEDKPLLQIPAGASMLLVFSLLLMISGAVTFWFRKIGLFLVIIIMVLIGLYDRAAVLQESHPAFGVDYGHTVAYNTERLSTLNSEANYQQDRAIGIDMLNNWLNERNGLNQELDSAKPWAVFVTASGGGLRSSYWTLRVMQHLDSLTQGKLTRDIRLMTGASGGMLGLSYFRELHYRRIDQQLDNIHSSRYLDNISKDLLNRVFFKSFTDMFLPNFSVEIDGKSYIKESGYSFDDQLVHNMPEFKGRKLGHYQEQVQKGLLPPVIMTPTILNQARKLYISSIPVSYLTRENQITDWYQARSSGVEFRRMFETNQADSIFFATAIRMNATFPYILPIVQLPSTPRMEIMDAGAIDNYGIQPAINYLFEFKDWFKANTQGIMFIHIRDNVREDPIEDISRQGFISRKLMPVGGGYYSMTEAKDMANDDMLRVVREWYTKGKIEVFSFEYPRENIDAPASLSWHLTKREKENIYQSINTEHNQYSLQMIKNIFVPPPNSKELPDIQLVNSEEGSSQTP